MNERWVLVVEDDEDDERLATRAFRLSERAERFVVCQDGEQAMERLEADEPPCLILLDLKLPRISGIEVLETIRERPATRHTPVVVLTSSDERSDVAACYAIGCNAFVRKPIDYDDYLRRVGALFTFWLEGNVTPPLGSVVGDR